MMRVLLMVDDWEALERYEDALSPHFELLPAPFGKMGIELAQTEKPDAILIDLVFEDLTPEEASEALGSHPNSRSIPLLVIGEQMKRPFTYPALIEGLRALALETRP